ncbi:hypothetical protein HNR62_001771 [Oceanisphaera litoralis]|uniref:hypothetical protein n=1 Tax=Oceanisphaera litoralis TaxID=225144 RepID=UPI00195CB158|nr:hypothetical protein [Oceanisphaera litoralis]MBM7455892.1 hypothetical protein [Oceanisphaera litoralis]
MATLLLSREQLPREPLSRETDNAIVHIAHWSSTQQTRLLAKLAAISQGNRGWILIANAPAPLSRRALVDAGINPARVIEVKRASGQLLQQAMACTGIAALVCWQSAGTGLPTGSHCRQSVFMINQHNALPPSSLQTRCTPGHFMADKAGFPGCMRPAAGDMAWRDAGILRHDSVMPR